MTVVSWPSTFSSKFFPDTNFTKFHVPFTVQDPIPCEFSFQATDLLVNKTSEIDIPTNTRQKVETIFVSSRIGQNVLQLQNVNQTVSCDGNYTVFSNPYQNDFIIFNFYKSDCLSILSWVFGWTYFLSWSISFYPQVLLNHKRKSTSGLSPDFCFLNVLGFLAYSVYNSSLYSEGRLLSEFMSRNPYSLKPVQLNDLIFSIHALVLSIITFLQVLLYDGLPKFKTTTKILFLILLCYFLIFSVQTSYSRDFLSLVYLISYIKLAVSVYKYIPQAYDNYLRKSTTGWSIQNVLLDFSGGIFSLLQMAVYSHNFNVYSIGNPIKFGLGLLSIAFDGLFMFQHYILYSVINEEDEDCLL